MSSRSAARGHILTKVEARRRAKRLIYQRAYRAKHKRTHRKQTRLANRRYRRTLKGWEANLLTRAKRRAERHGREFALTREWLRPLLAPMVCAATGVALSNEPNQPNVPSIDRRDSSKGYTPDNCWVVSWEFNNAKKDKPLEETFKC